MNLLFTILILMMGIPFLVVSAWLACASVTLRGENWGRRVAGGLGGALMFVGGAGFFGMALSACGGLDWLPESF